MITRSKSNNKNKNKKCSVCRISGHDIRNCTDIKIQQLMNEKTLLYYTLYKKHDGYKKIKEWVLDKTHQELSILAFKLNVSNGYPNYIKVEYINKEMLNELLSIQIDYILCKIYEEPVNDIKYIEQYEKRKNICGKLIDMMRNNKLYEPVIFVIQVLNKIDIKENPNEFINYVKENIMYTSLNHKQYFYACYFVCEYMTDAFFPKEKEWDIIFNEIKSDINTINECPICFDTYNNENTIYTNCKHTFCKDCIKKHLNMFLDKPVPTCPICRTNITEIALHNTNLQYFV
jgi:hypothetical protein